jgi:hypothetical protein
VKVPSLTLLVTAEVGRGVGVGAVPDVAAVPGVLVACAAVPARGVAVGPGVFPAGAVAVGRSVGVGEGMAVGVLVPAAVFLLEE